jgi:hypothetical protein
LTPSRTRSPPGWEDVAEASLVLPEGNVYRHARTRIPVLAEAGSYRARLHAAGRDTDYDDVVDESKERHLVQLWKALPAATTALANASAAGKSLPRFMAMWQRGL